MGGAPLPELAEQCIASWQKHMPDWKYMRWDETNFPIADAPVYVREAYVARKYAFGGLYMDIDFEVFRPFDDLMDRYPAFAGYEGSKRQPVMQGVIASEPHGAWVSDMLLSYTERHFVLPSGELDLTPNTGYFTDRLESQGFVADGVEKDVYVDGVFFLHVFPVDYFCPVLTTGEDVRTERTYCEHKGESSWAQPNWKSKLLSHMPSKWRTLIIKTKRKILR